jgi:hypothetical protein
MQFDYPNVRQRLDEIYQMIDSVSPNLRPLVTPKDYAVPLGFGNPQEAMLTAFNGAMAVYRGHTDGKFSTDDSCHVLSTLAIRYQMPTYFVSEALCEALLRTDAPGDVLFSDILWPLPVMMLVLPQQFSVDYFGSPVPFLLIGQVEQGISIESPLKIYDQSLRPVTIGTGENFFCCVMTKWENDFPMHYDARSPMSRHVKDLMTSGEEIFTTSCPPEMSDKQEDIRTVQKMTNLAVNLLLAMTSDNELVTKERMLRPTKSKNGVVVRRALWKPNFIGEHYQVHYEHDAPQGSHRSPHAHWRRGHWRNQRFGPKNSLSRTVWIAPVFVGISHS